MGEFRRPGEIRPDDPRYVLGLPATESTELPPPVIMVGGVPYRRPNKVELNKRDARRKRTQKRSTRRQAARRAKATAERREARKRAVAPLRARAVRQWWVATRREERWRARGVEISEAKRDAFAAMVAAGMTWREILESCDVSEPTVARYMRAVKKGHPWPALMSHDPLPPTEATERSSDLAG